MAEQFLPTRIGISGTLRQTFALLEALLPGKESLGGASYSASPPSPELGFPAAFPPRALSPASLVVRMGSVV